MARNGFKVMDSDMHIMEPPDLWQRYIDAKYRDVAPRGLVSENVRALGVMFPGETLSPTTPSPYIGRNYERNQALYADHSRRGWSAECQLEAMDVEGIDVSVLFPSRGLNVLAMDPQRDPAFAAAIARAYNNWLYDFCDLDRVRLRGAAMISIFDVRDAIAESQRAVGELGFDAVFVRATVLTRNWHDPYYEPLWAALEDLGVPIGFHEATGGGVKKAGEVYEPVMGLRRIYSQPMENMLAMASFLCAGVLERHPRLRVAFLEANCSWAPWLLWRMDEGFELEGDIAMPELTMKPSDYFRRQCYLSVEPDELPARHMIDDFGSDRLVFSTDYPHGDSRYPHAVDGFLSLPLSEEAKRRILWDNCAEFYSITASANTSSPAGS